MTTAGAAQEAPRADNSLRVLILTPIGRDAALAEAAIAQGGLTPFVCSNDEELRREIAEGAGSVLLTEEALPHDGAVTWRDWFGPEPAWSPFPVVILLARGRARKDLALLRTLEKRPNIVFLERPVQKRALISALRNATEARRLQYAKDDALNTLHIANRRKDEFLVMLAHELRNPLAPISNGLHILRRAGVDAADGARMLDMMARQVEHLVRLLDDLLEVSRISRGKIEVHKEPVDLARIVDDVVSASQPTLRQFQHELTASLPKEPLPLIADATRMAQAFTNLLNNAAKFTKAGGRIVITVKREGAEAVVSVKDNGIGIAPDKLQEIFELFVQVENGQASSKPGLGIGLALARSLVEMHGGSVEARSEGLGKGSEFIVHLPLAVPSREAATKQEAVDAATALPARRVLVVDDNTDAADSLAIWLRALGSDVRVAYDGPTALGLVGVFRPEMIFLDLGMPEMDGYETAQRIRNLSEGHSTRIIALSGWGQEEARRHSLEAGIEQHLVKPLHFGRLQELLEARR